jgi:hypothetical protein
MGLSEEINDSFQYSYMPEDMPTFIAGCQKREDQISQRRAEKAANKFRSGVGFTSLLKAPAPPEDTTTALAGTVAG